MGEDVEEDEGPGGGLIGLRLRRGWGASLDGMYDRDDEKKDMGRGNAQLNSCSKEK